MNKTFYDVKVGDIVTRMLEGNIPMKLKVTEITMERICCGKYFFGRHDGREIDDDISITVPISHLDESKL